jgi:hypothetical protein
LSEVEVCMNG